MEIATIGQALRSQTRVNILKILGGDCLRAIDVYSKYNDTFPDDAKHREFIYLELERLVKAGILDKEYDKETKMIIYSLRYHQIRLNLLTGEVILDRSKGMGRKG
jgi:uncharacterized protein YqgQ